ncbi:hypothetical protein [Amycolatopsis cynarae]|uniref:hypothetical protein n=1 Tax=Amycolatopsis cynarae TaxID=2995223 RepID=UPI002E13CC2A
MTRLLLARPVSADRGLRARVAHIVPVPEEVPGSMRLTACCGAEFGPGELELLDRVTGMPCEGCLSRAPRRVGALSQAPDPVAERLTVIESAVRAIGARVEELAELLAALASGSGERR